ncbi:hypothetical protein CSKR_200384 [Clonorchis sinensis]|uniref:Uncharacterized protein n=1 Tax=Clonorchis sinensis TaxID=79923 RepID=A0A8T1ME02_CLOSI|nr:hypothetical protein CSKR_200384 [Clonorchis sinensis]
MIATAEQDKTGNEIMQTARLVMLPQQVGVCLGNNRIPHVCSLPLPSGRPWVAG